MSLHTYSWLGVILPEVLLWPLIFSLWYRTYLRMSMSRALVLACEAGASGVAWAYASGGVVWMNSPLYTDVHRMVVNRTGVFYGGSMSDSLFAGLAFMSMVMFSFGLFVRAYRAWVTDSASETERLPSALGVRAWLRPLDLVTVAAIVAGAYVGMGWSIWATAAGALSLLLAYPLMNCMLHGGQSERVREVEDLTEERRRVLALVEAGKISGEDGAELIAALGQSRGAAENTGRFTWGMRLMLLGAVLLVVGFCLPWFEINEGALVKEAMQKLNIPSMGLNMPGDFAVTIPGSGRQTHMPYLAPVTTEFILTLRGGDLQYGLGWIILALGLGAAVLPLLWAARRKGREVQRGVVLAALIAGSVILIYEMTGVLSAGSVVSMGVGLFLVILGYSVVWAGAVREYLRPGVAGGGRVLIGVGQGAGA